MGARKATTPRQMLNAVSSLWRSLRRLGVYEEVLSASKLDLTASGKEVYFHLLLTDIKYFIRKNLRDYCYTAQVSLFLKVNEICQEMKIGDEYVAFVSIPVFVVSSRVSLVCESLTAQTGRLYVRNIKSYQVAC